MGWIDLSIVWFARRKVKDSHLIWQENGLNFLYGQNATIGLDSNFYVFTFEDYGKQRQQIKTLILILYIEGSNLIVSSSLFLISYCNDRLPSNTRVLWNRCYTKS